jgi:benzodiazapine receptor
VNQIYLPALIIFILLCQATGILGSAFTIRAIPSWYRNLNKPNFNPPNWVFGPVWTALYLLMGISGYLLWQADSNSWALKLFFIQFILNALWTPVFFGAKKLGLAFANIVLMWVAILATIIFSWQLSFWAAALLLPYLAWVSFASVLNFCIWQLNKNHP